MQLFRCFKTVNSTTATIQLAITESIMKYLFFDMKLFKIDSDYSIPKQITSNITCYQQQFKKAIEPQL